MNVPLNTAILIFSRTAADEARAKTFSRRHGRSVNRAIAQQLIRHTHATARQTGLPVFTCFSTEQYGSNFGERLANAMESVFRKGFARVIAIGNDSPDLSARMLKNAAGDLGRHDLVLGPAADGGVYLIGMSRPAYDRDKFLALPWQDQSLQKGWKSYGKSARIETAWLSQRRDIDHEGDLQAYLRSHRTQAKLRQELMQILHEQHVPGPPVQQLPSAALAHAPPALRAPPH